MGTRGGSCLSALDQRESVRETGRKRGTKKVVFII